MSSSGPLVFIHTVAEEEASTTETPTTPMVATTAKSGGVGSGVLCQIGDEFFYWNALSSIVSPASTPSIIDHPPHHPSYLASSTASGDQSTDTVADWTTNSRGHSDPNLRANRSSLSAGEDSLTSSFKPPDNTNYAPHYSPIPISHNNNNKSVPWQRHHQPLSPLNNNNNNLISIEPSGDHHRHRPTEGEKLLFEVDDTFFPMTTTIVNNRGGFFSQPVHSRPPTDPFRLSRKSPGFQPQDNFKSRGGGDCGGGGGGVKIPPAIPGAGDSGGNGSSSTAADGTVLTTSMIKKRPGGSPHSRRQRTSTNASDCLSKPARPSLDTNVISLTDNPGAPMLKTDSTLSLGDVDSRSRPCCFCWCCCCSCSCVRVRQATHVSDGKRSPQRRHDEPRRIETQLPEQQRTTYGDLLSWAESFDNLMRCFASPDGAAGQKAFRDFLRSEYSEENILFWLACEDIKCESSPELLEEKARIIYEDYISILSPKEVSLDSRVREIINNNMAQPTPNTFDEAQLQIYTLMQRDSYPRFLRSRMYKDLLAMTKRDNNNNTTN